MRLDSRFLVPLAGVALIMGVSTAPASAQGLQPDRMAIEAVAAEELTSPQVTLDMFSYNSQRYYIVEQDGDQGEHVHTFPITGNETALDAIAQLGGITSPDSSRVWISRPPQDGIGAEQVLPVDWDKIKRGESPTTNYQILPGDRVFIASHNPVNSNS